MGNCVQCITRTYSRHAFELPLAIAAAAVVVMPWDILCRAQLLMETANDSSLGPDAFLSIVKQESANKIECARLSRSYGRRPRAHQ